jgi:ABC-type bacteriocin/lantibiotic exporter with double-glycine peptidase domain
MKSAIRLARSAAAYAAVSLVVTECIAAPPPLTPGDDLVCGPRCVQQVLRHFGQEADLIELTRETQWPDIDAGATMESLDQALRRRGIHTRAVRVPEGATFLWPFPAIVHTRPRSGSLGHYVVWLPSSTANRVDFWAGPHGVGYAPAEQFWQRSSRAALLTGPEAITRPQDALTPTGSIDGPMVLLATGIVPLICWMICQRV